MTVRLPRNYSASDVRRSTGSSAITRWINPRRLCKHLRNSRFQTTQYLAQTDRVDRRHKLYKKDPVYMSRGGIVLNFIT